LPGAGEKDASGSGADLRFPRACRLTTRRQFLTVYAEGRRVASKSFTFFGLPNSAGTCRLGITVTRKVGGAVRRNRIKRRLRDVFRRNRTQLAPGLDLVINAHVAIDVSDAAAIEAEFMRTFRRLAGRAEDASR
jgi:ribonuclease P protein component